MFQKHRLHAREELQDGRPPSQPLTVLPLYRLNSVAPGKTKLLGTYQKVARLLNHYNGSHVISSNLWYACLCFTETRTMIFTLIIIG